MPTDVYGNEYLGMVGRSRSVTHEQHMAIIGRGHDRRGCCDERRNPPVCCRAHVPSVVFHAEGDEWVCPICRTVWVVDTDEAEGSAWYPVPTTDPDSRGTGHTVSRPNQT